MLLREPIHCSYHAGMVAITIRNVPDEVRDELAARAARSGRSLQEYLAAQLADIVSRPALDDTLRAVRRRVLATGRVVDADMVTAALGADRR